MYQSPIALNVEPIIKPSLEALGYDVVRILWQDGQRPTLQIMAERSDTGEMTVEDCTEISHTVSALLDVEDPIPSAYDLEVSSPGIDRPLTRLKDFVDYIGYEAKVEMQLPIMGRKRFKGEIVAVNEEAQEVSVSVDKEDYQLPYVDMQNAKLVMNDALVGESLRRRDPQEPTE